MPIFMDSAQFTRTQWSECSFVVHLSMNLFCFIVINIIALRLYTRIDGTGFHRWFVRPRLLSKYHVPSSWYYVRAARY